MKLIRTSLVVVLTVISACTAPPPDSPVGTVMDSSAAPVPLPQAILPDGFVVMLELAITPEEITNGLMFRPSLPENRGMLFLLDQPRLPTFWMKNMLIPLDLVFFNELGTVVDVIPNVQPCAADPCPNYPPSSPALAVLEIGAGLAAAHGLEAGSLVQFERVPGYPVSNSEF